MPVKLISNTTKIIMKGIYLFICFLSCSQLFSQNIENILVSTTDDLVIIYYDLSGLESELYDVKIDILDSLGNKINAPSLNGDLGKVVPGKEKTIVWNVYKDVDGISGKIVPQISAQLIPSKARQKEQLDEPTPKAPSRVVDVYKSNSNKAMKKRMRYGIKLGLGRSNVIADQQADFFKSRFSSELGFYLRYYPKKRFHLQAELLYKQHHYKEFFDQQDHVIHPHKYVKGQLIGGIAPIGGGLHFNFGGYYGYLFSGDQYDQLQVVSDVHTLSSINPNTIERFPFSKHDYGYVLGGSFSVFRGAFVMGVQITRSLQNFVEDSYELNGQTHSDQSLRNKSTQFYLQKSF